MKKLFLLLLMITPVILCDSIDDLEREIKQSNIHGVQKILNNGQLSLSEQQQLLILAKDIVRRRQSAYESHFSNGSSKLVWFELSRKKVITLLAGSILFAAGIIDRLDLNISCLDSQYFSLLCNSMFLVGSCTIVGTFLKHFYDVKKLYDSSIEIKHLILKAISAEGNFSATKSVVDC